MCYLQISIYLFSRLYYSLLTKPPILGLQGFWYFAEKKAKFREIFRGKFAEKWADFAGFLREKSQNSWKIGWLHEIFAGEKSKIRRKVGRFRGILAEKNQISKDFQGQILRKIGGFHGKFQGKLRQETISKKQPISLDFFWQISLKSINFALIWPAMFNVFLTAINHLLFQQQFTQEMSEC